MRKRSRARLSGHSGSRSRADRMHRAGPVGPAGGRCAGEHVRPAQRRLADHRVVEQRERIDRTDRFDDRLRRQAVRLGAGEHLQLETPCRPGQLHQRVHRRHRLVGPGLDPGVRPDRECQIPAPPRVGRRPHVEPARRCLRRRTVVDDQPDVQERRHQRTFHHGSRPTLGTAGCGRAAVPRPCRLGLELVRRLRDDQRRTTGQRRPRPLHLQQQRCRPGPTTRECCSADWSTWRTPPATTSIWNGRGNSRTRPPRRTSSTSTGC